MLDFVLLWPLVESSLQSNRARERFSIYFAPTARSGVPSSVHASTGRSFKQTENLSGEIVTPGFPFKLGSSAPGGSTTSNWCISVEKNKKSSNLAKVLPRHIRLPTPKAVVDEWKLKKKVDFGNDLDLRMKNSGFSIFPSSLMKRDGLNSVGLFQSVSSMWT